MGVHPVALCEDGNSLAGHLCSHEGFVKHDMGFTSDWKHEHYDEHCGKDNWELEYIEDEDIEAHEGLQKAIKLNQELPEEESKK